MKQKFIFLFFLSTLISNAQLKDVFKKGWITKKDNSKIEGFLRTDELSKLSSKVCFKENLEDSECENYDKTQIKSFQIGNNNTFNLLALKMDNNYYKTELFVNLILEGGKLSLHKSIYNSEVFYVISENTQNYILQNDKLNLGEKEIKTYDFKGKLNLATENLASTEETQIEFEEDYFIDLLTKYNTLKKVNSKDLRVKNKTKNFVLTSAGINLISNSSETYAQIIYRKYQPRISKSTSLNLSLNYFNYQFKEHNKSLTSIPLYIQQNILNKSIRPYIFTGFSFNYVQVEENGVDILKKGFQKSYGLNFLYGAGIEVDVFKNIYIKSEYRHEYYSHPIVFGIGYIFKM